MKRHVGFCCNQSWLGAALLVVHFDLVLDAIIQLKVVVLQCGGASRRQTSVGAGTVEQQPSTNGP